MQTGDFTQRIEALRARLRDAHGDPRLLHDDVRHLVDDLRVAQGTVPADIREALEALESEILEEFYDNLPV